MRQGSEFTGGAGILFASCIGVAFGLASIGATYTLGIFVRPLSAAFGWSREEIMNVISFLTLGMTPAALLSGWISDRIGVFRLILVSQIALGATFIALGVFTHSLAVFYAIYFLMALVSAGTLPITFGKRIAAAFSKHRGLALGLVLCGTGVCALTVPSYAVFVLSRWGWRAAYVAIGLLPLLVGAPLTLIFLRRGAATPESLDGGYSARPSTDGGSLSQALGNYRTWSLCAAFFLISGVATSVLTNLVPMLEERSVSPAAAAGAVGVFGVAVIFGRLSAGALIDRVWAPLVASCFLVPAALALWAVGSPGAPTSLLPMLMLPVALATGMELDLSAFLIARYFPVALFGRLYATLFIAIVLGGAVASKMFGRIHDLTGSYAAAFAYAAGALLAAAFLLLLLGRYPRQSAGAPTREPAPAPAPL